MPVLSIQTWGLPQQGLTEEEQIQLHKELENCTEVVGTIRNSVESYMKEKAIRHIEELDYTHRQEYESWLSPELTHGTKVKYLTGFDWIKRHAIREKANSLLGRNQKILYENKIWFLLYYPDQEVASRFNKTTDKKALVWDFQQKSPERMKRQIFQSLQKLIADDYSNSYRAEKLGHLKYFYNFCCERGIEDIEYLETEDEAAFRQYLEERRKKPNRIIDYCREVVFTEAKETNWDANVWYLSRFCFEKVRVNQSNMVRTITFQTVRHLQNRKLLQEYMKYGVGLSTLSLSSLLEESHYIQGFLAYYNETEFKDARKLTGEKIDTFFKYIEEKKIHPNTFNRYVKAVDHFYQYLLTRYQVKRIPFHKEYYLKAEIYRHHDRSVEEAVSKEILKNLRYFPEEIRLMYLHLWAVGMRISEVCTIKAKEYYRQDDDYWMQIYQVKMRNYKRIPIPEVLYRLMQVYIKKKRRKPEDYVFQNQKGGAFCSSTFRCRMKKLCEIIWGMPMKK